MKKKIVGILKKFIMRKERKMRNKLFRKGLVIGIIILFFGASIISGVSGSNVAIMECDIYVDDDNTQGPWDGTQEHPYQYIQDGIDNANPRDIICVCNGTYYENLDIEKEIELRGGYKDLFGNDKDGSIIDGRGHGDIVRIHGLGVNYGIITGFTIQNTSGNGIYVDHSVHITITDNILKDNHRSIFLFHSGDDKIIGNLIFNNSWAGLNLEAADHSRITQNCIYNNNYGFILSDNSGYNDIILNGIINNDKGMFVARSRGNRMMMNNFKCNDLWNVRFKNCFSKWDSNYWDDKKPYLPFYVILGVWEILVFPGLPGIPIFNIDSYPASGPYHIPGCDIDCDTN